MWFLHSQDSGCLLGTAAWTFRERQTLGDTEGHGRLGILGLSRAGQSEVARRAIPNLLENETGLSLI